MNEIELKEYIIKELWSILKSESDDMFNDVEKLINKIENNF